MAGVTYICKRTVVSSKPVEPGKMITTSILDRLMEQNHLRFVYYYSFPGQWAPGEVTKLLRESCSELLTSLTIVTGRLVRDNEDHWIVKCNDAGVRVIESRVGGCMEDWLRNVDCHKELNLIHWEDMYHKPYFWSTFYIQLTEFEKGGIAIGLSCTHLLADHVTVTNFIKAWADTTLYGKPCAPLLIQSLPHKISSHNVNPRNHLINSYKSYLQSSPLLTDQAPTLIDAKHATITLKFTDDMMRSCIAMTSKTNKMKPFEALAALFWVSISKLRGISSEGKLVNMSICADARNVLGLQHGFFGNCTVYNKVSTAETVNLGENETLSVARKAVEEAVDGINHEGVAELINWLESRERGSDMSPASNGTCHELICAKLDGREAYSAMFQDGIAPARVSCYMKPWVGGLGHVLVLPAPPGEGALSRVVMVTLAENEALMLCRQELILRFSPSIVMGVHKNYA